MGKVFSILLGVFTISIYVYGSIDFLQNTINLPNLISALTSLFFLVCAGYLMNDCCDLKYDLKNRPEQIYITKAISEKNAKLVSLLFFISGLLAALLVNVWFLALIFLDMLILVFYNLYSKKLFYLKNVIISLVVVSIYPLSFAITSGGVPSLRRDSLFIFPIWLFLIIISYEFSEDILDIEGDRAKGGKTVPIVIGAKRTRNIATLLALISIPIAFIPFFYGMCGRAYLIGALITLPVFVVSIFSQQVTFSKGSLFFIRAITASSLVDIILVK
ncbi:MAG: UbiA family prenyltransferase [Candidatus Omnitrophica bacterium]|nr:UbiA family prenyltransferase [Candidatus Omnitrophota bacterium]